MAALKFRKKVLLLKTESTYGTDSVPTGAANALLASNVEITPLMSEQVTRENVQPYLGSRQQLHVGVHVSLEFDVEMAGSGTAATPTKYGPALLACAHAEAITTSVAYTPVSAGEGSSSIYFHMDGQKHALLGARGTAEWRINAKQIPVIHFALKGLYVAPAATADPTPTLSGFTVPKTVGAVNTPTFTLHTFAGKLQSFTLTQGNAVEHIELVGEESVQITDRQTTGQIVIEAPALGTKDFFAIARAETLGALQIIHGSGAGGIVQIDAPSVQLLNPTYSEQSGRVMLSMGLNFVPSSAGNDEYTYTTK
jgi:hypothetical protein